VDEQVREETVQYGRANQFTTTSMSRINNYIPFFPNAKVASKYSEEQLISILEFAVPPHCRKAFDF
jgi:hypothetical protein